VEVINAPATAPAAVAPEKLTLDDKFIEATAGIERDTTLWLLEQGWIPANKCGLDLDDARKQQIVDRADAFRNAVKAWKDKHNVTK
jgi:hypothetical protein